MKCAACQHDQDSGTKFCEECGHKLLPVCAACGVELKPTAKFCPECGASTVAPAPAAQATARRVADYTPKHLADKILQSKSALEGERKQVTVLFADIQGSMQLATQLDPEHWHHLLERYFAILTDAVHRFEGTVNQYTGDGIMALFGAPIAHEDHAQRAGYAALQARDQLRTFADELRLARGLNFNFRIGLNSGDVVVGRIGDDLRMDYTAQGATVGIAQRIEQFAAPGHVYISGATARLVAGYFQLRAMGKTNLQGLAEALPLFELESTGASRTRLEAAITRGLSRFVGRTTEMQTLEAALARAQSGHGQVIGIVGEPGLGKSRLCFEFVAHCRRQGLPVFEAHCPAHGKNIPYLPILELFRNYFGISAQDDALAARQRIAGALVLLDPALQEILLVLFEFMGVGDPKRPPPPMDAEAKQRQLYEMLHQVTRAHDALGQLTVTLIDDLHWVDAGSDAFVGQLVNASAGRRSLLVLNFRPEYVAAFAHKPHYQQLPLVPLGDVALRELIADLIGRDASVTELTGRIIEWTTGNPFYTEELINALVEAGDLIGRRGDYQLATPLERLEVPTNVRAVLGARIDRLPEAAKRLLQTAAVIGKEFSGPLLDAVTDLAPGDQTAALERLKAGDFIYERALYPVFQYAFKHPLTHEVAYQSPLRSRRAVVHAAVARALETQAGGKLDEQAALLAHHCEEAGEVLNAARWHRRAAEWAGRTDFSAAIHHWERVRTLVRTLPVSSEAAALGISASMRLLSLSWRFGAGLEEARTLLEEGQGLAQAVGDRRAYLYLSLAYSRVFCGIGDVATFLELSIANQRAALDIDDIAVQANAWAYLVDAFGYSGQLPEALRLAEEGLARFPQDIPAAEWITGFNPHGWFAGWRGISLTYMGRLQDAMEQLRAMGRLGEQDGTPELTGYASGFMAYVGYYACDAEHAMESARHFEGISRNLGDPPILFSFVQLALSHAYLASRQATDAIESARLALELFGRVEKQYAGHAALLLAEGLLQAGEIPSAVFAAETAIAECQRSLRGNIEAAAHGALARALLRRDGAAAGDVVEAALDRAAALIERTGARTLAPALCEWRAELAAVLGDDATQKQLLQQAEQGYAEIGAPGHVQRLAAQRQARLG